MNLGRVISDVSQAHQGFGSRNIIPLKRAQVLSVVVYNHVIIDQREFKTNNVTILAQHT